MPKGKFFRDSLSIREQLQYSLPSAACLKDGKVEKAAYAGFVTCFNGDWNRDLGIVDPGRRAADGTELATDRETVRGTERTRVRRDIILRVMGCRRRGRGEQ